RRPSSGEPRGSCPQHDAALSDSAADDRPAVAKRVRRGGVRAASTAGGNSRMDRRAEKSPRDVLRTRGGVGICSLRRAADVVPLPDRSRAFRAESALQTDARDAAVRAAAAGLLAARAPLVGL